MDGLTTSKVIVKVAWPTSVLVKETHGEGGKPGVQVMDNLALTVSIQNKEKEVLFLYFFNITEEEWNLVVNRKNIMQQKSSISSRLMKVDRKMKWHISLMCHHWHQQKQYTRLENTG